MILSSLPTVASSNWYGDHGNDLPTSLITLFTKLLLGKTQSTVRLILDGSLSKIAIICLCVVLEETEGRTHRCSPPGRSHKYDWHEEN